ncbi:MAG: hypothetical protein ABI779_16250 [Acidobacteriota bacterium]
MRTVWICVAAMLFAGCGARENADHGTEATSNPSNRSRPSPAAGVAAPQNEVTDERVGAPVYPGAEEVESSRYKLSTPSGVTYTVSYRTPDTPTQVAAFYRAEFANLGTLKESISTGEQLKTVAVDRTDGTQSIIRASTDGKHPTVIAVFRFYPAKP